MLSYPPIPGEFWALITGRTEAFVERLRVTLGLDKWESLNLGTIELEMGGWSLPWEGERRGGRRFDVATEAMFGRRRR